MFAKRTLETPIYVEEEIIVLNKALIGKEFRENSPKVYEYLENLSVDEIEKFLPKTVEISGEEFNLHPNMIKVVRKTV